MAEDKFRLGDNSSEGKFFGFFFVCLFLFFVLLFVVAVVNIDLEELFSFLGLFSS